MNYRFTTEASEDLHEAADFYESRRSGLGAEFAIEVGIGIGRVLDAPRRWPEEESGIHKYRLERFPYGLFYRLPDARTVVIIAVFDLRRKPGSWRRRAD